VRKAQRLCRFPAQPLVCVLRTLSKIQASLSLKCYLPTLANLIPKTGLAELLIATLSLVERNSIGEEPEHVHVCTYVHERCLSSAITLISVPFPLFSRMLDLRRPWSRFWGSNRFTNAGPNLEDYVTHTNVVPLRNTSLLHCAWLSCQCSYVLHHFVHFGTCWAIPLNAWLQLMGCN